MKSKLTFIGMVLGCVVLLAGFAQAQPGVVSGVPGDGIPDIYYFGLDGLSVFTSAGSVSRPAGTLLVDTDGTDMVVLLIGGQDFSLTTPDDGNYLVGNTTRLPDPAAPPPLFSSDWIPGFINGASQWVRTNPLGADGFVGVIGEYDDPFGIFPDLGVANYGLGATFDAIFDDGNGRMWSVVYATNLSGIIRTCVTGGDCIPEPTSSSLLGFAALGMLSLRLRQTR